MRDISYGESLSLEQPCYIDVRAPIEFNEDHITGALNIPIFDDVQRAEVGTLYKMAGREQAVLRGTEIAGGKLSDLVKQFQELSGRNIIVYCARGGMRSKSVAGLIDSLGIPVYRLIGGYKEYRRYVNAYLNNANIRCPIFVLQGLTGTGKTEILRLLENTVDFEDMAGHRSSIFGDIGLEQRTQKSFETQIFTRLEQLRDAPYIVMEGESRKIGNLHIPDHLFSLMSRADIILIKADIERRIEIILNEYSAFSSFEAVSPKVSSLTQKLGKSTVQLLLNLYKEKNLQEFVRILLEKYYDPLYVHSLKKMSFIASIENPDSTETAFKIVEIIKQHLTPNLLK